MNIKILAAASVLVGALIATSASADDHGWRGGSRGGDSHGHWDHDRRGSGDHDGGWNRGGRGDGGHWNGNQSYGRSWNDDHRGYGRHESYRDPGWNRDYRHHYYSRPAPGYGYRPDYGYAPRYYAPSYYAPGYYAPQGWGGWFDDLGVVIQFDLH